MGECGNSQNKDIRTVGKDERPNLEKYLYVWELKEWCKREPTKSENQDPFNLTSFYCLDVGGGCGIKGHPIHERDEWIEIILTFVEEEKRKK